MPAPFVLRLYSRSHLSCPAFDKDVGGLRVEVL